jgi:hypothetical protein
MQFRHGNWHEWLKSKHRILRAPAFWTILHLQIWMALWPIWSQEGTTLLGHFDIDPILGCISAQPRKKSNSVARMVRLGYSSVPQLSDFETQSGIRPYLHQDLSSTALKTFCCSSLQSVFLWICLHPFHQHTGPWCQILVLTEHVATICQSGLYDLVCITDQF